MSEAATPPMRCMAEVELTTTNASGVTATERRFVDLGHGAAGDYKVGAAIPKDMTINHAGIVAFHMTTVAPDATVTVGVVE